MERAILVMPRTQIADKDQDHLDGPDPMAMILKHTEHIRCPVDKEQ